MKPLLFAILFGFSGIILAETPVQSPLVWKDSASGRLFYVESDGLHASAIDKDGNLLWCTDMTTASALFHIKRATKIIGSKPTGTHLEISFGDTDSAVLDVTTGKVVMTIHD